MDRLPLTVEEAKKLKKGTKVNLMSGKDFVRKSDGSRLTYKVTSVKTWKRQPEKVEVVIHYGLKGNAHLREWHFSQSDTDTPGIVYLEPEKKFGEEQ